MRLLTVGNMYPPHHFGGYELVWHSAVEHLRADGHAVRVLTTDLRTDSPLPDDEDVHRELHWHFRDGDFVPQGLRGRTRVARHNHAVLAHHLDAFRPDVISWWSMGGLTITLLEEARRRELPAVAFVHDDWLAYGPQVDPWTRAFLPPRRRPLAAVVSRALGIPTRVDLGSAARYVFVSEFTRRRALGLGLGLRDTGIAHSGIHQDYLSPAPEQPWEWRLLYTGRLDPRKGVETAIQALAELPEASLTLLGGGDDHERARLEDLAARLGVADRVVFRGHARRAELLAAYAEADAVVFPVLWDEPWGLVPLEAMARGRPVAATGRGGSGEYLRDGENCVLFEAGDAGSLASALRRLAADDDLRARLRREGLTTASIHTEAAFNAVVQAEVLQAAGTAS